MRKWYDIQYLVIFVTNLVTLVFITVGEVLTKKDFLYTEEVMAFLIGLLVLSGVLMIIGTIYSKDNEHNSL